MSKLTAIGELERMVDHFGVFASDHSMDASTETWAALHCAKAVIAEAKNETPSQQFAAALTAMPSLAKAAGCYVAIKVYGSKAECDKAEGRAALANGDGE